MNIGKIIKELRKKRGVPQREIVKALGISQGYLSLIENGDREPSVEMIKNIADALQVPQQLILLLACDSQKKQTSSFSKPLKKIASAIDDILTAATT